MKRVFFELHKEYSKYSKLRKELLTKFYTLTTEDYQGKTLEERKKIIYRAHVSNPNDQYELIKAEFFTTLQLLGIYSDEINDNFPHKDLIFQLLEFLESMRIAIEMNFDFVIDLALEYEKKLKDAGLFDD